MRQHANQIDENSKRIGFQKINLSDFIEVPVKEITIPMDSNDHIFLTLSISVTEIDESSKVHDIVKLTNHNIAVKKKNNQDPV